MAIRVALHHRTTYNYDRLVGLSPQTIRLRPAPQCRTPIKSYSMRIEPKDHFLNIVQDPQGNFMARAVFPEKTRKFEVVVDLVAEMTVINPFDFFLDKYAEVFPWRYDPVLDKELAPFLERLPTTPLFEVYAAQFKPGGKKTIDFLVEINQQVQRDISYTIRMEPGVQTPEQTLAKRSGSCRDSAWLLVQVARSLGLAARFVSGYLIQLVADQKSLDGPSGPEKDFTDLHAWTEIYLPGAGWVGLDPTSGLCAAEGHIPLAATPDPGSAAPITGLSDKAECEFGFDMKVTRIQEDPRVTKPYTEEQWEAIVAAGHKVDEDLVEGDVRLTMGGEPTFVSIDDMEGAEWNISAVGPTKRRLAEELIHRQAQRLAPGGLLHFGQGKWYPGESLPRWALTLYWRTDGEPLWRDPSLLARADEQGHDIDDAATFTKALGNHLGIPDVDPIKAYEDPWHYLVREGRLPANVDPTSANLEDPEERARLRRVFSQGLGKPVGLVLPIERGVGGWGDGPWRTGKWPTRDERLYLVPGDSPLGLRLPLDALGPAEGIRGSSWLDTLDPTAPRGPLPPASATARVQGAAAASAASPEPVAPPADKPQMQQAAEASTETQPEHLPQDQELSDVPQELARKSDLIRTALTIQPWQGAVRVFMPPTRTADDYVDLLHALEAASAACGIRVQVEGYAPPKDHRIRSMKVTPDPGVIEVNIQPASSWTELVEITTGLYEDARNSRLGTEKFQLDGRHAGSGGGNHLVLGGATPTDSPFLRRPDLLRSLIAYWNNHPSLSFLFSGLFVGPTSQAPRADEGRPEAIHELEIAFKQIPETGAETKPWLVDRIFRNLLTDLTGNTHRAEFCIDKLYSPDGPTGRLGLLEFRGFEMPPHARMSCAQQLLMRALVARFWKEPCRAPLVRWGTQVHDKWMLPHFIWADFRDVLRELREFGYPLQEEWFAPHLEFRFPRIGEAEHCGVEIELRTAIEPWLVLGEEATAFGPARYVDSSIERVQVKARGLTDGRHLLTVAGRRLPLRPTGVKGEAVCGVRYRAWQPPSCLHPTIGIHSPLVLDVHDTWSGRSIGGCTYHVVHPGGRGYETFPINAAEAETRRATRFFPNGHTPGAWEIGPEEPNPEYPCTLDLRR